MVFFYGQADAELFLYLSYNYEMYAVFDYAIVVVWKWNKGKTWRRSKIHDGEIGGEFREK